MMRFEGVDEELQKLLDANMDHVHARRRAREAFKDIQLNIDHILFKTPCDGLKMEESYEVNSRGVEIFSKSWIPESGPKAIVCYLHAYGDTVTFFFEGIARKLASAGYGILAMDYPGFGLSEGLHGYLPHFDVIVNDVTEHYSKVRENTNFKTLPWFLFGQSMGGAVALKMHLKQPDLWSGAFLLAPMCKLAEDVVPPWIVTRFLFGMSKIIPKHKLIPLKDMADLAFRDPKKRKQAAYNVVAYKHKPRLATGFELLRTTSDIEQQLEKVSLPLLILHGKEDKVTDPLVSKTLYERASSRDKKLNLYYDASHALLEGEPDDVVLRVFGDIISWLDERC